MPITKLLDGALKNQLLAALPESEFKKIRPALDLVSLETGDVLWEAESKRHHIFFPTTAIIGLFYESNEGVSIEVGLTGRQGLVGVSTFMAEASMATRAVTFYSGDAYRMKASDVKSEFSACGDFQDICMYFTQILIAQISQKAICNRLHAVEQHLCRFLLYIHDHQQTNLFIITHDQISQVLGVRRESVSLAAAKLQENKLIEYSRGKIKLLDRKGLENFSCECYHVVNDHYQRVLGKYISKHKT